MASSRLHGVVLCLCLCAASWSCGLHVAGIGDGSTDIDGVEHDAEGGTADADADADRAEVPDGDVSSEDAGDGEDAAEDAAGCTDGLFECLPGGRARRCVGGAWEDLGTCRLGCNAATGTCYHPSNLPEETVAEAGRAELVAPVLPAAETPITVDGDSGSILGRSGAVIRNPGEGVLDGVFFGIVAQPADPTRNVAVFVLDGLDVPAGVTLRGAGTNPIAFLTEHGIHVYGTIDMGAGTGPMLVTEVDGQHVPGPGGHFGGAPSMPGAGPCPGLADGGARCGNYCTSGGGGGGLGGRGGDGGDGSSPSQGCTAVFEGGAGGGPCGTAELVPLFGGSGGGGGGRPDDEPTAAAVPGTGGAGGGAFQMTSLEAIHVYPGGGVTAPGGGGGGADLTGGGGGGGGAGGGLLLEAPTVVLDAGGFVAANGGGGGSGDCT
ncbi:MAG: hypothetical protein JXB32_05335 [Deltaproteobacteria bacterium]|nr:hypothetical protein [Deltaproteobacteria bacterium]